MRIIRTKQELRAALLPNRRAGEPIGLVPTMGALHAGHASLIRRADSECDVVVVSLFVNPTQFNEASDLTAYPRNERADAELAEAAGADILFAPDASEIYPDGFATSIHVGGITEPLEGAHRGAAHFDGVATVVTKLLNIAQPDVAYFGQKDAQQALVVGRLVRDLDLPVRIAVGPTVREPDGLAMSSRNVRLDADSRRRAAAISRGLGAVAGLRAGGERDPSVLICAARAELEQAGIVPEYLELVDAETLDPAPSPLNGRPLLAVVAAHVGGVRLIDNAVLAPPTEIGAP